MSITKLSRMQFNVVATANNHMGLINVSLRRFASGFVVLLEFVVQLPKRLASQEKTRRHSNLSFRIALFFSCFTINI